MRRCVRRWATRRRRWRRRGAAVRVRARIDSAWPRGRDAPLLQLGDRRAEGALRLVVRRDGERPRPSGRHLHPSGHTACLEAAAERHADLGGVRRFDAKPGASGQALPEVGSTLECLPPFRSRSSRVRRSKLQSFVDFDSPLDKSSRFCSSRTLSFLNRIISRRQAFDPHDAASTGDTGAS